MKFILLLAIFAVPILACADLKAIQGTWKAASGEIGGKSLPKELLAKMILKITGNRYDYDEGNGHDLGDLKLVPSHGPSAMDIIGTEGPNKGKTYLAIYRAEGDTLTIIYGLGPTRPTSFEEKNTPTSLVMKYHRTH